MSLFLIAALALLQGPAPSQPAQKKIPPIQTERYARDLHDKNLDDLMDLYTSKAAFEADGKTVKGLENLRKLYEQSTTAYDTDLQLTCKTFGQTGAFAIEHGTYTETLRDRTTGATQQLQGTYVFLHEKQSDGSWLIARQKWTPSPLH